MDIKQLKYFLQICKNNNFSETAKKLYITQQGLSKSIKNLEDEFKLPLFYRDGTKMRLTKYGLYLKENSEHIIKDFDSLKYSIEKMASNDNKRVRIGYSLGIASELLYDQISNFRIKSPNIELKITEYQDFLCEEAVSRGEIDLGITVGPVDESRFDCIVIKQSGICLIVNDQNKLLRNAEIDFRDISGEKIIIQDKNFKIHHNFVKKCRKVGFEPNILFTTANFNFVKYLSRVTGAAGVGIYLGEEQGLNYIPLKNSYTSYEVCLITKKNYYISNDEKVFIKYILNNRQSLPDYNG